MENTAKVKKGVLRLLGKRNLIIFSVVVLIGLAVYLNYLWFYDPTGGIGYGENNMSEQTGQSGQGDTPVAAPAESNYFTAAALTRQTARDEAMEVLQNIADTAEGEERETALSDMNRLALEIANEANIESLIKSHGYSRCVVVINGEKAAVVVSDDIPLESNEVAKISAIAFEQAGILPVNLTVKQR